MRSMSEVPKMRQYLRTADSGRETRSRLDASSTMSVGLMAGAAFLENAGDHLIERRILDAHVDDRVLIENDAEHFRDPATVATQIDGRPRPTCRFAEALPPVR